MYRTASHFPSPARATALLMTACLLGLPATVQAQPGADILTRAGKGTWATYKVAPLVLAAVPEPTPVAADSTPDQRWARDAWRLRPRIGEFSRGLRPKEDYDANRRVDPDEFAAIMAAEYGTGSVLSRSISMLAGVASFYERETQAQLDKVNSMSDRVARRTSSALGSTLVPRLRLRSEVKADSLGIGFRHRW